MLTVIRLHMLHTAQISVTTEDIIAAQLYMIVTLTFRIDCRQMQICQAKQYCSSNDELGTRKATVECRYQQIWNSFSTWLIRRHFDDSLMRVTVSRRDSANLAERRWNSAPVDADGSTKLCPHLTAALVHTCPVLTVVHTSRRSIITDRF